MQARRSLLILPLVLPFTLNTACEDDAPPARKDAGPPGPGDAGPCEVVRGEPDIGLELVASGLRKPVFVTAAPGDPRLFVLEQHEGTVRIVEDDKLRDQAFLDIGGEIGRAFEQGIIGLTFHPHYAWNGRFFIAFTRSSDDSVVIEEWTVSGDPNRADPATRKVLLVVEHSKDYHNGGALAFGPDGYLYIALGDGGPQVDAEGHGQNLGSLRGKLLRIDVDVTEGDLPYGIPPDNPLVAMPDARPEIYAYGLRNPWGVSIDPATGHIYLGDVGYDTWEEIDVLPHGSGGGQNYGWSVVEGASLCVNPNACDTTSLTPPVYEYHHDEGCSVIGGAVYRGCRMPGHHGAYFFTDFCAGWVRSLRYSAAGGGAIANLYQWSAQMPEDTTGIGVGADGELYILDHTAGDVYRIVPIAPEAE